MTQVFPTLRILAYPLGVLAALFACFFVFWVSMAVGILGVEGDPADRMYLSAYLVGALGVACSRFKARGMAMTLAAMTLTIGVITGIAFLFGMHLSPISSIWELFGVNAIFAAMFGTAAGLFWFAAQTDQTEA